MKAKMTLNWLLTIDDKDFHLAIIDKNRSIRDSIIKKAHENWCDLGLELYIIPNQGDLFDINDWYGLYGFTDDEKELIHYMGWSLFEVTGIIHRFGIIEIQLVPKA